MITAHTTKINIYDLCSWGLDGRSIVIEEALRAVDVGSGGSCARDGFGAYGTGVVTVAGRVVPRSIVRIHPHAVLALAPVRIIHIPVCERAVLVHY